MIITRAHDFDSMQPITSGEIKCRYCGLRINLRDMHIHAGRCIPHLLDVWPDEIPIWPPDPYDNLRG